jgi:hypothetical protein
MGAAFDLAFSKGLVSNTIQTKTLHPIIDLVELRYKIGLHALHISLPVTIEPNALLISCRYVI